MAEIIDTSVFNELQRGNQQVASNLQTLINNGQVVVLPAAVHQEILNTPDPVTRAANCALIQDLPLQIQPNPGGEARADQHALNARINAPGVGGRDVSVIADVQIYIRNNPGQPHTLWTMERMRTNPGIQAQYGVQFSPRCNLPSAAGNPRVHYNVVRGLFQGLAPITIAPNGAVTPGGGGGGGGGGGNPTISSDPTPGFNPSRIQGAAAALQELMVLAERMSMMVSAGEAWAEFKDRENEVMQIQNANPMYPTWISFTFTYAGGNGEQSKIYKYLPPMEIKSGGSPPKHFGNIREFSHDLLLPALKTGGASSNAGGQFTGPAWLALYTTVKCALEGDTTGWGAENPGRAHQMLNGCAMYDMLKILRKLCIDDPKQFRLLENTVWNPYGVCNSRNAAAIVAARMTGNTNGNKFSDYKAACKEYGLLPDDQKKDVEDFLNGGGKEDEDPNAAKKAPAVPEWLPGWWTVYDGTYYYYHFTDNFAVAYVKSKPASAKAPAPKTPSNRGKVIVVEHGVKVVWGALDGCPTQETYTRCNWTSETEMNGVSNKYSPLFARRLA
jgi:hypothetical protein